MYPVARQEDHSGSGDQGQMGVKFKLRMSRVLPSLQPWRSKSLQRGPVPNITCFSPSNPESVSFELLSASAGSSHSVTATRPPPRRLISTTVSIGCRCGSRCRRRRTQTGKEKPNLRATVWADQCARDDQWLVVTPREKIDFTIKGRGTEEMREGSKTQQGGRRKKTPVRCRSLLSTSSGDNSWFSSDEREAAGCENRDGDGDEIETETLFSSHSISTDSTREDDPVGQPVCEDQPVWGRDSGGRLKAVKPRGHGKLKARGSGNAAAPEAETPARLSVFHRLLAWSVERKVRESYAVVKRSEDPYGDFRRSMVEMIVEKQMFEEAELWQLLHCFLSLNSRAYHGIIVKAFSEICQALCGSISLRVAASPPFEAFLS